MSFGKFIFGFALLVFNAAALAQTYAPNYSEKIEADNGATYAVDLKSARRFAAGVEAGVYDEGRGGIIPMYFDCAGHIGELGGPMSYVAPRSVGAQLAAIACAEANRHPER